jgi:peptidoglycan/xylan/chitin deacetylase (PgdA/CDA1 family)
LNGHLSPSQIPTRPGFRNSCWSMSTARNRDLANIPKMSVVEIRQLVRRGFEVGSHAVYHCDFRRADVVTIGHEIADSKAAIDSVLGSPVHSFSVPLGSVAHCHPKAFDAARRHGHSEVLSRFDGAHFPGVTDFHLRRVRPPLDSVLLHAAIGGRGFLSVNPDTISIGPSSLRKGVP